MAGRASFSGNLTLGLVRVGVRAFAMSIENGISLNWLHRECVSQVSQAWRCKSCGMVVDKPVKGYYTKGKWVVIEREDLAAIGLDREEGAIPILTFVRSGMIPDSLVERFYFLTPYSPDVSRPYYLLAKALSQERLEAVVSFTSRDKSHLGVVYPVGEDLAIKSLYYYDEVRSLADYSVKHSPAPEFTNKEVQLARNLVKLMRGEFRYQEYLNSSKANLIQLIEAKAAGRPVIPVAVPATAPKVLDLSQALETSLRNLKELKKVRKEASGRKPQSKRAAR